MSAAFLIGTPLAIGAIAVYGSTEARSSASRALVAPALPMTLMLLGCAATLLEGSICIALMAPLFYFLACSGGLCMHFACRFASTAKPTLCAFAALPILLLPLDRSAPVDTFHELRQTVLISAPPSIVWERILNAKDIRPGEMPMSLTHLIGVPRPVGAVNKLTREGETRFSNWEKDVQFSALVTSRKEAESITWRYAFAPDSFPPGTMDEHVVIGGRYIDLGETTFNLSASSPGTTQLEVVGRYRLTTPVNFYAIPVSKLLGHDFLRSLLGLYKVRSERAVSGRSQ
jgi:hypothetical protein